jgi:hypothetical protein
MRLTRLGFGAKHAGKTAAVVGEEAPLFSPPAADGAWLNQACNENGVKFVSRS